MNITKENTGNLTAEINIHLLPEDYKHSVNEELKRHARQASLPGFRPGKVPVSLIRKRVGMAVLMEELNKTLSSNLSEYIREEKIKLLGDPLPKGELKEEDFDVNCETELDFTYEIGLAPELEVNFDLAETPALYDIIVDDEFLGNEIDTHQDRLGQVTNPETVAEGDIIYGKIQEVDAEGNEVEEGFDKMIALNPMRIEKEGFFTPFFGKNLEESVDFDPFSAADEEDEVASIFFIDKDELDGLKDKKFIFSINKINRVEKAKMDEEFFKNVAQSMRWENPDEITTEEAFKDTLQQKLEEELKESAKWYYRNQLQKQLLEANAMELPEEFLKRWMVKSDEKYTEENVDEEFDGFSRSLSWSLIVEALIEKYEIKIGEEELVQSFRDIIRKNLGGMEGEIDESREDEFVNHAMQNREMVDMQYRRLLDEVLYEKLEADLPPEKEDITATKFAEMSKADQ